MESHLKEHPHFEPTTPDAPAVYTVPEVTVVPTTKKPKDAMSRAVAGEGVAFSQLNPQSAFLPPPDDGRSLIE